MAHFRIGLEDSVSSKPEFYIGQIVYHEKFGYRGVVFDVDGTYQGSEMWYDQVALSRPPKDKPWYHVLVDQAAHTTYVAERHLRVDKADVPISHPQVKQLFGEFCDGAYQPRSRLN
ncbi:MAG TPA: heat shock protein HspQ [Chromatiaceae bacterium]|jgi:heat shock protein HspQ|nr:heat shock protein HspQ [Chromatiaceae bacterium]HIN83140.1 heat shock protein HspQ [Chromatiales bacterium]HIA08945.1 heat shock protein HspQ [Chromatiaceae bacterium]HIB84669.1 heat shock protein HspQ [Chromatiaceae bacterium]HIO14008.1 heat shock protein HspQ [Chromatiales bacterium]